MTGEKAVRNNDRICIFWTQDIVYLQNFDGNLNMFDTSNFNTFNVLDKKYQIRVPNDIGPLLFYSINIFKQQFGDET